MLHINKEKWHIWKPLFEKSKKNQNKISPFYLFGLSCISRDCTASRNAARAVVSCDMSKNKGKKNSIICYNILEVLFQTITINQDFIFYEQREHIF
jgi:hypothetical protein